MNTIYILYPDNYGKKEADANFAVIIYMDESAIKSS